jgi:hypothetical protein
VNTNAPVRTSSALLVAFSVSLSHETIVPSSWQSLRIQEKNWSEILYENAQRMDAHERISKSATVSASCFIQLVNFADFFQFSIV